MQALMVNPRRRRRRSRRRRRRNQTLPVLYGNPRRRYHRRYSRRRNPTLSVINPRRGGGMMGLVVKGATVAAGAVLGRFLMARLPFLSTQRTEIQALAQMGLGIGVATVGRGIMGKETAENLGIGTMVGGIQTLASKFIPGMTGLGIDQIPINEGEIDSEIRELVQGGVSNLGLSEDYMVQTLPMPGE